MALTRRIATPLGQPDKVVTMSPAEEAEFKAEMKAIRDTVDAQNAADQARKAQARNDMKFKYGIDDDGLDEIIAKVR